MNDCSYSKRTLSATSSRSCCTTGSSGASSGPPPRSSSQFADHSIFVRLAGDQRPRLGDREVVAERRRGELLVVVGPGLVVVVDGGQHRVAEDAEQLPDPAAGLEREPAAAVERPAALPLLLVLVAPWVALSGPGLDVVEPDVLDAGAVGPGLLAGDRAGVAADALVEVHDHGQLRHDLHQRVTSLVPDVLVAAADHRHLVALVAGRAEVVEGERELARSRRSGGSA